MLKKTLALAQRLVSKITFKNVTGLITRSFDEYCFAETFLGQIYINKRNDLCFELRKGDIVRLTVKIKEQGRREGIDVKVIKQTGSYTVLNENPSLSENLRGPLSFKKLKKLFRASPENTYLSFEIANRYYQKKNYPKALKYLSIALIFNPDHEEAARLTMQIKSFQLAEKRQRELAKISKAQQLIDTGKLLFGH